MPYTQILALIDAELDRLQRAHDLLSPSPEPIKKLRQKQPVHALPVTAEAPLTTPAAEPAILSAPVEAVRKQRRLRRAAPQLRAERKPSVRKPRAVPLPSALGRAVPAGPVYVPAEQVRMAQSLRNKPEQTGRSGAGETLTAEHLSMKWLQNSTA